MSQATNEIEYQLAKEIYLRHGLLYEKQPNGNYIELLREAEAKAWFIPTAKRITLFGKLTGVWLLVASGVLSLIGTSHDYHAITHIAWTLALVGLPIDANYLIQKFPFKGGRA